MAVISSLNRRWNAGVLFFGLLSATLIVSSCAPQRTTQSAATQREAPVVPVEARAVQRGDIQQTLSYSGDLRAKSQITVFPKATGRVQQVLVDVGSRVQAGDVLAVLEQDNAEIQMAQARASLASAQAQLARIQAGGRSEDIGAAGAAVQAQQAALAAAQARLELMQQGGRSEDTANAQIAKAQAGLDAAKAKLASVKKGATNDKRQGAASQLASATAAVQSAQVAATNAATVEGAAVAYRDALKASLDQNFAPSQADILAAQAAADQAHSTLELANNCQTAAGVKLEGSACDANKTSARGAADLADAKLSLLKKGGTTAQQAQVTANLAQAEAGLKNAQTQRASVNLALTRAQEDLKAAQATYDQLVAGAQPEDLQQAEAAVTASEQDLQLALNPNITDQDLAAQQAQVEQLSHAVQQAQFQLQKARSPYTAQDLQAAQAGVDQAQAQLDLATLGVRETTITAPVGGVIADRQISPGALVGATTPVVTLVPPELELVVNVDEAQLGQVAEGQQVSLQVPAYAQRTFTGRVQSISPVVDTKSRTAAVRIAPQNESGQLRSGMFARLDIVTASKTNALLVPKDAVVGLAPGGQGTLVGIGDGNKVKRLPVRIGLVGDKLAEVVSGVQEGQLIATSGLGELNDGDVVAPQAETKTASLR